MPLGYKKVAGTWAVFLREDYDRPSPVERDGMIWQAAELVHGETLFPYTNQRHGNNSTHPTNLWVAIRNLPNKPPA